MEILTAFGTSDLKMSNSVESSSSACQAVGNQEIAVCAGPLSRGMYYSKKLSLFEIGTQDCYPVDSKCTGTAR
jgi:hypothetical protein